MAKWLTFVFQPESSCRHANIREEVEIQLVGRAVEERWDGGASGEKINSGSLAMLSRAVRQYRQKVTKEATVRQL